MNDLFVYGSLMNPEVYELFIHPKNRPIPAILKGYQRFFVLGYSFPGIKADFGTEVEGLLFTDLTNEQIKVLDNFEAEWYSRKKVEVVIQGSKKKSCEVYLFQEQYFDLLSDKVWDNQTFREKYMQAFISRHIH